MDTTTIQVADSGDRKKIPTLETLRPATFAEIAGATYGQTFRFVGRDGRARNVRVSSVVKRWKTRPEDLSVAVKYGMYESDRVEWREGRQTSGVTLYVAA